MLNYHQFFIDLSVKTLIGCKISYLFLLKINLAWNYNKVSKVSNKLNMMFISGLSVKSRLSVKTDFDWEFRWRIMISQFFFLSVLYKEKRLVLNGYSYHVNLISERFSAINFTLITLNNENDFLSLSGQATTFYST